MIDDRDHEFVRALDRMGYTPRFRVTDFADALAKAKKALK